MVIKPYLFNNLPFAKPNYINYYKTLRKISSLTKPLIEDNSKVSQFKNKLLNGPHLKDFFENQLSDNTDVTPPQIPYVQEIKTINNSIRKVFFEVYGCQMNVNDTEIVLSILKSSNKFQRTYNIYEADVILIVTCAIRDSAEERIWGRLDHFKGLKRKRPDLKVGILGCMAERLKDKIFEKHTIVDLIAGPDSYRDLPRLLTMTDNNQKSVNVLLSFDETYADIQPVRLNENAISAYVSIMRGCDNMCSYCIVPFTRGRERSRPINSILKEVENLSIEGVKEVTLLGQNVNSYRDTSLITTNNNNYTSLSNEGFKTVYKLKKGGLRFADLLHSVANVNPEMRIRFTSPHPKDFPDEVLTAIKSYSNVCKSLHMPAQSGNDKILEKMRRGYTRKAYVELIENVRRYIPDVALSSDFICGFCGENEEEFNDTLSLIEEIKYTTAYMFPYSMRERTTAHRRFQDDVPYDVKRERLERMIKTFRSIALKLNTSQIGKVHLVLIEGLSKRSENFLRGRNDNNVRVILPGTEPVPDKNGDNTKLLKAGDYVAVYINAATSQVLKGIPLYSTCLKDFYQNY